MIMGKADYILEYPWPRPPLTMNHRLNRWKLADWVASIRETTAWLGDQAGIKPGSHMTVQLHYAPGRKSTLDAHNLHLTTKCCVDGLARGNRRDWVGLEIVPNDTKQYVTIHEAEIHYPPTPGPRWWLAVSVDS